MGGAPPANRLTMPSSAWRSGRRDTGCAARYRERDSRNRTGDRARCPAVSHRQSPQWPPPTSAVFKQPIPRSNPCRRGIISQCGPVHCRPIKLRHGNSLRRVQRGVQPKINVQNKLPNGVHGPHRAGTRLVGRNAGQQIDNGRSMPGVAGKSPAQLIGDAKSFGVHKLRPQGWHRNIRRDHVLHRREVER